MSFASKLSTFLLRIRLLGWCQPPKLRTNHQRRWRQKPRYQRSRPAPKGETIQDGGRLKQQLPTQNLSSPLIPSDGTPDHRWLSLPSLSLELLKGSFPQVDRTETAIFTEGREPYPSAGNSAEKTISPPIRTFPIHAPLPVRRIPTPDRSALDGINFWPVNPSFLGCIEEPEGRPVVGGCSSEVWRCKVRFYEPSEAHPTEVAVKVLRSAWLTSCVDLDVTERMLQRFHREVKVWRELASHPNIVPLIGWATKPNPSFISPWYKQGNLYRHLKDLSNRQQLRVLLGIAKGLESLHSHSPPVVHGDLKPENVLLSDSGEPLLTDFGLSTILSEETMYTSSYRLGGSVSWMSPECIRGESMSCQSDVYSFGSLAFTVLTGGLPYTGLTDGQITLKVSNNNDPNGPVEDWSKYPQLQGPVKDLLMDCWSLLPSGRPSTSSVVGRLTTLLESRESESHGVGPVREIPGGVFA